MGQHLIVLCGDAVSHRKPFSDSFSTSLGLTVVRCSGERENVLSICKRLNASLLVAKEAFIQLMTSSDFLSLDSGGTHVLAILASDNLDESSKMLRLGCRGVLPLRFSLKLLQCSVQAVLEGEVSAPPRAVAGLLSELLRGVSTGGDKRLTPQERRILEFSAQGYKNSAIASALSISQETVRWHKRRLHRKLGGAGTRRYPQTQLDSARSDAAAG